MSSKMSHENNDNNFNSKMFPDPENKLQGH